VVGPSARKHDEPDDSRNVGERERRKARGAARLVDVEGAPLQARIGINRGPVLVGIADADFPSRNRLAVYETALERFRSPRWLETIADSATAIAPRGGDPPSQRMIDRRNALIHRTPEGARDGVTIQEAKE
jgi:hypothetical protein